MKILLYEEYNGRVLVTVLYQDNTFTTLDMLNTGNRDEILKDVYIISSDARNRLPFKGEIPTDAETWNPPEPMPTNMVVNFYNLTGKVYNQYGEEMEVEITFTIEETDKAKIEDGKIVEEVVTEDTSFLIVAKCGELEQRQERTIYAPVEHMERPDLQSQIETLKKEIDILTGVTE